MYIKLKLIISKIIRAKPSYKASRTEPARLVTSRAELGSLSNRAEPARLTFKPSQIERAFSELNPSELRASSEPRAF
ncbi:hypothetical protein HanIR_Chr15g0748911 [Helianthus annuus]|nr:hypothetical protein HanIR_Chr15g0748911 [Helianthus annuus]